MRIALLQHPWQLTFRGKWDWSDIYNDPRGMSGSELGFVEIGRALVALGHTVTMFTDSDEHRLCTRSVVYPWPKLADPLLPYDLAIGINHAGGLGHFDCPRIMIQWLNSHEYLSRAEYERVDLFLSPSEAHREFILSSGKHELSDAVVDCDPSKWAVVPLGCTPELYEGIEKVPGRVVYASSPDRGLHHLLQAWPSIKRRVPGAELKIYYRILPWIEEMKAIPEPFEPCEENRQRALFIEDALRRLSDPKWGVEVVGPVSRNSIVKAMGEAQVLAYPCDTLRWSEGFSCTVLEACAAGATPVIWDCDALGSVYRDAASVLERGDMAGFVGAVALGLNQTIPNYPKLNGFAREHTWRSTCQKILTLSESLIRPPLGPTVAEDSSSSEETTSETHAAASST